MLSPLVVNAAGMVNRTTVVATRACLIASLVWNIHFGVEIVGIDETSLRRGQDYITVVHDLNAKRLLFATAGRDHHTVLEFAADLKAHGGDPAEVQHVGMDMSAACRWTDPLHTVVY